MRIKNVAAEFVTLQVARHAADYDTSAVITQADAQIEVLRATGGVHRLGRGQNRPSRELCFSRSCCAEAFRKAMTGLGTIETRLAMSKPRRQMSRRVRWIWLAVGLSIIGAILAACVPTYLAWRARNGETLYRERPTSHWREILRARTAKLEQSATFRRWQHSGILQPFRFYSNAWTTPTGTCGWPAMHLLGEFSDPIYNYSNRVLPAIRKGFGDQDVEVRLQAVIAMRKMGPNARPLAGELARLLSDPEYQICHFADVALWEVDANFAPTACDWKKFSSKQWGFSAMLPAVLQENEIQVERWGSQVVVYSFKAQHRVTLCIIAVSEYPVQTLSAISEEETSRCRSRLDCR